jgi:hypothetical protein
VPNEGWKLPDTEECKRLLEEAATALAEAKVYAPLNARLFIERIEDAQDTLNMLLDDLDHIDEW